jgi:hypothetical protein
VLTNNQPAINREGMVMLWITQYLILVIMSAKERSPVFPDMLSSIYYFKVSQGGIDPMKDRDQEMENY